MTDWDDDALVAVGAAIRNVMLGDLALRVKSLGGMRPVLRSELEHAAIRLLMLHVARRAHEKAGVLTAADVSQIALNFASLWKFEKDRILKLIPLRDDIDDGKH